jgi:hypothetical protein
MATFSSNHFLRCALQSTVKDQIYTPSCWHETTCDQPCIDTAKLHFVGTYRARALCSLRRVLFQQGVCPYRANLWSFEGMDNRMTIILKLGSKLSIPISQLSQANA